MTISLSKGLRRTAQTFVAAYIISHLFTIQQVRGKSMAPTLNPTNHTNDIVVVERITPFLLSYGLVDVNYTGKVVSIRHPFQNLLMIKRVTDHTVKKVRNFDHVQEFDEGLMVEGDDPFYSTDSRSFGKIPTGLVYGAVVGIIYPLSRMRLGIPKQSYKDNRL
jgi:signal peptidase I